MAISEASTQAANADSADVIDSGAIDALAVEAESDSDATPPDAVGADALGVMEAGGETNDGNDAMDADGELDVGYFRDVQIPPPYGLPPGH
jgi:hypothetical protein